MQDSEIILKDSFRYSISSYLVAFLGVVTSLATRRLLGPLLMGTFGILMLIFQYSKYHHLGIFSALERELPFYNGKGNLSKVQALKDIGFTFTVFTSLLVSLGIIVASFVLPIDKNLIIGMRLLAIMLLMQSAVSFLTILVKTHHKFTFLSKYNLYVAVLEAALVIYLGLKFGLFGILWANVIIIFVGLIYLLTANFKFSFRLPFSVKESLKLLKIGTPLIINDFAFVSLMNMDKFSIIKFVGKAGLGYYSIAVMVTSYIFMLPNLIYSVLYPRFYESFGRLGDIRELKRFFEVPTVIISYFMVFVIGYTILALPFLIKYAIPKFASGIMAAEILLLGIFFISLLGMSSYVLIAMNKQIQMIALSIMGILFAIFFNYLFVKRFRWNIEGAAGAMLSTYFIYGTIFICYAFRHYSKNSFQFLRFIARIYLPFIWLIAILFLSKSFFVENCLSFKVDCLRLFLRALILTVFYIPLLYYLNRKTMIIDKIIKLIKTLYKK